MKPRRPRLVPRVVDCSAAVAAGVSTEPAGTATDTTFGEDSSELTEKRLAVTRKKSAGAFEKEVLGRSGWIGRT